jgi:hypothetical protein
MGTSAPPAVSGSGANPCALSLVQGAGRSKSREGCSPDSGVGQPGGRGHGVAPVARRRLCRASAATGSPGPPDSRGAGLSRPAMWTDPPGSAKRRSARPPPFEAPTVLVHEPVMVAIREQRVVQARLAAVGPMDDVVRLREAETAARETDIPGPGPRGPGVARAKPFESGANRSARDPRARVRRRPVSRDNRREVSAETRVPSSAAYAIAFLSPWSKRSFPSPRRYGTLSTDSEHTGWPGCPGAPGAAAQGDPRPRDTQLDRPASE